MSFPAHHSYEPSHVDWVDGIPTGWKVRPFRHVFKESAEKIDNEVVGPMLSVSGYRGIEIKEYDDENRRRSDEDLIGYRIVRPGQLVVNTMWLNYAGLGVSEFEGHVSPAYRAYWITGDVDQRFLHHLMRSETYVKGYTRLLTGIRPNSLQMSRDNLMSFPVLLPPSHEQRVIADFLDRETAKIDALIEEQQRLTALLDEKRRAVISQAVTKGLDPNVPMKNSGIEWLGDVPAHWEVLPLRRVLTRIEQGWSPSAHDREPEDGEASVLKLSAVKRGRFVASQRKALPDLTDIELAQAPVIREGDFLLTRANTPDLVGDCAIALDVPRTIFSDIIYRLSFSSDALPSFMLHLLQSWPLRAQMRRDARGSSMSMAKLSHGHIKDWWIVLPPLAEQSAVAEYVLQLLDELSKLGQEAEAVIRLLQERRAALISEAVTGKIDVRGSASVIPFPIDQARARGLVATEIIERSAHQATFGRVKLQKIAYLAEAHVGIAELSGDYAREAAGPLDREMVEEMESGARFIASVAINQSGGIGTAVTYRLGSHRGGHRNELTEWLGAERTAKLDKLIADFADLSTHAAEAVATLYAVWNDKLIEGASPSDDEIASAFLTDWHPEKPQKFRADELVIWLYWMRRHGLVPTGCGSKTFTGRLFV